MNEYLQQIFAAAGGQDIDPDVAAAGAFLSKVAEEQGVDLDQFSDEEIGGMLQDIMGGEEAAEEPEAQEEEAPQEQAKAASDEGVLTVADVTAELAKTAALEGIDLAQLDREQMHQAFNWQLEQMQTPGYFEQKVAEEQQKIAMQEKVAEADMLGRVMAHSFNDELAKLAADVKVPSPSEVGQAKRTLKSVAGDAAHTVKTEGGRAARAVGQAIKHNKGKAALGAAALTAAGAYGAKKLHDKKKAEGEQSKAAGLSEHDLLEALTEFGWTFE